MKTRAWIVVASLVGFLSTAGVARQQTAAPQSGLWHLVPADTNEQAAVPEHRIDVRLYLSTTPYRAAIVNRNTNQDMLPYEVTEFDGKKLRLGQRSAMPCIEGSMMWVQMEWDGVRFKGNLVDDKGNPLPPGPMKLIRSK